MSIVKSYEKGGARGRQEWDETKKGGAGGDVGGEETIQDLLEVNHLIGCVQEHRN